MNIIEEIICPLVDFTLVVALSHLFKPLNILRVVELSQGFIFHHFKSEPSTTFTNPLLNKIKINLIKVNL